MGQSADRSDGSRPSIRVLADMISAVLCLVFGLAVYVAMLGNSDAAARTDIETWRGRRDIAAVGTAALVGLLFWSSASLPPDAQSEQLLDQLFHRGRRRGFWVPYAAFAGLGYTVPVMAHLVYLAIRSRL